MRDAWTDEVLDPIEDLLKKWADRGDDELVNTVRPAWRANAGLTDGWADVLDALGAALRSSSLPPDEAATIGKVADRVERAILRR
ncbi:MAG: hypothetical protein ACHQQS_18240 [Thermoanaerobaculales bacterium]